MRAPLAATATLAAALVLPAHPVEAQRFRIPGASRRDAMERIEDLNPPYDGRFQFVRLRFDVGGSGFGRRDPRPWAHDYPRAERNFMRILTEITGVRAVVDASRILAADDPELFRFPVAYIAEVGYWNPSDAEARTLGEYLRKGGFLIVDDFRDFPGEWANFEHQMSLVLPGHQLVQLDGSHEIFDSFFRIEHLETLAPPTYQQFPPMYFGIFEDNDRGKRLMVIVNFNNDIGDYWEYSDRGYYPIDLSNEAYKLGVNYIVYGMTH